jgi:D-Tyr-tRNAtyr deacylase
VATVQPFGTLVYICSKKKKKKKKSALLQRKVMAARSLGKEKNKMEKGWAG